MIQILGKSLLLPDVARVACILSQQEDCMLDGLVSGWIDQIEWIGLFRIPCICIDSRYHACLQEEWLWMVITGNVPSQRRQHYDLYTHLYCIHLENHHRQDIVDDRVL